MYVDEYVATPNFRILLLQTVPQAPIYGLRTGESGPM